MTKCQKNIVDEKNFARYNKFTKLNSANNILGLSLSFQEQFTFFKSHHH